jgi:hypothetical protein
MSWWMHQRSHIARLQHSAPGQIAESTDYGMAAGCGQTKVESGDGNNQFILLAVVQLSVGLAPRNCGLLKCRDISQLVSLLVKLGYLAHSTNCDALLSKPAGKLSCRLREKYIGQLICMAVSFGLAKTWSPLFIVKHA